jgi:DNA-binding NarL/FixJ family response regulator
MRDGLRAVIEQDEHFEVVVEASTGRGALAAFESFRPDVALIDLQIEDTDILNTIIALRRVSKLGALVLMSIYPGERRVKCAISLGATSYLLKTATGDEILEEIRSAVVQDIPSSARGR